MRFALNKSYYSTTKKEIMRFRNYPLYGIFIVFSLSLFYSGAQSQTSNEKIKKALKLIDLGNPKQAVADLRQLTAADSKNPEAHAALAIARIETGDLSGAEKEVATAYD